MIAAILISIIGAAGTIFGAYLLSRQSKQDKLLERIEINVNSRLDALLAQSKLDNIELGQLREANGEHDKSPAPE